MTDRHDESDIRNAERFATLEAQLEALGGKVDDHYVHSNEERERLHTRIGKSFQHLDSKITDTEQNLTRSVNELKDTFTKWTHEFDKKKNFVIGGWVVGSFFVGALVWLWATLKDLHLLKGS